MSPGNRYSTEKGLKAHIESKDEMSGIAQIYYSINKAAFANYASDLSFDQEKEYELSYYGLDNVGNSEDIKNKAFRVDLTAPTTEIDVKGDKLEKIFSPRLNVTLTATDKAAGVKRTNFKFDNNTEYKYVGTFNLKNLEDGDHVITYHSIDNVNNIEEKKEFKFYLDKIAPEITSEIIGDTYRTNGKTFISGKSKVKLSATDNKAGVDKIYYSVDGKSQLEYETEFILDEKQGVHVIKFRAVDKVNNMSTLKTNKDLGGLFLDETAPTVSHSYTGAKFYSRDTMFVTSATKINLKASDYQSGVQKINYQLDQNSENTYENPLTVEKEGFHKIGYKGIDNVNNVKEKRFLLCG